MPPVKMHALHRSALKQLQDRLTEETNQLEKGALPNDATTRYALVLETLTTLTQTCLGLMMQLNNFYDELHDELAELQD